MSLKKIDRFKTVLRACVSGLQLTDRRPPSTVALHAFLFCLKIHGPRFAAAAASPSQLGGKSATKIAATQNPVQSRARRRAALLRVLTARRTSSA